MDWQRSLLVALLAIVSYMMILEWNKDYGKPAATPAANTSPQNNPQDAPQVSATADTPVAPVSQPAPDQHGVAGHLVTVETDALLVTLSTSGGDVVSVRLKGYAVSIEESSTPFTLLANDRKHVYVAQSGLVGRDGPDARAEGRPQYTAPASQFSLTGDTLVVPMSFVTADGTEIRKEFEFTRGSHLIKTRTIVANKGPGAWSGVHYLQIKRDSLPDPSSSNDNFFGLPTFLGVAYWTPEKAFNKLALADMDSEPLDRKGITGGWMALAQHYFLSAWITAPEATYDLSTTRVGSHHIARMLGQAVTVDSGQTHSFDASLYVGPKIEKALQTAAPEKGLHLVLDYGPLFFISEALISLMKFFHSLTSNWGVSIILLTLAVKLLFFYPSAKSYQSMAKMRMVQPEMLRLREQYGEDRQKLSMEMMKLYRDKKINPLGGCLPILIQMPVFLALYWGLLESVELRQAPFFGWIKDLSVMDPYFVLPLIMGVTMYVQQMLNPAPPDPTQARVMKMMPIIFTVMFLWFPAGLVVYWITNNTLSILQQWLITRQIEGAGSAHR
jgi:YidC/Oxa1 family membrane protein insertase